MMKSMFTAVLIAAAGQTCDPDSGHAERIKPQAPIQVSSWEYGEIHTVSQIQFPDGIRCVVVNVRVMDCDFPEQRAEAPSAR